MDRSADGATVTDGTVPRAYAPGVTEAASGDATAGRTVAARFASRSDIAQMARRERITSALWPVPVIFGLAALVLAGFTTTLDRHGVIGADRGRFLVADESTALTLTSVVATGMLVFLGIVFSTTLVAIQLAASQYSPRVVRVFLRSRLTKVALGVFVATFVFALAALIEVRSSRAHLDRGTPVLSLFVLSLLVLATLVVFLVFANGTARLLRVQYLIERVATETRRSIAAAFPPADVYVDMVAPAADPRGTPITSGSRAGVLDAIDLGGLAAVARAADGWIEMLVPIGSYIGEDAPIAVVHGPRDAEPDDVRATLLLSNERTLLLDPGCGIRQIADIAIRGLSPAVNDPTTAVQAIDRLADLLARAGTRPEPTGWYLDDDGTPRLAALVDTFDGLVRLAFVEIVRYGAESPQVIRRLNAAFDQLEQRCNTTATSVLGAMRALLQDAVTEVAGSTFADISAVSDLRGLG